MPIRLNGVYYAARFSNAGELVRISGDLQTVTPIGPPAIRIFVTCFAVVNGQVYAGNGGSSDVFVMKLDASGNILYSTFFGGSGDDRAVAMTVDAAGNVFVTGTTNSQDFPVSKGAYASSGNVFVFRLNADGSIGYSTHFTGTSQVAIGTDGSVVTGVACGDVSQLGGFPTTPQALATTFCCKQPPFSLPGPESTTNEATLTRFDAAGSSLVFSTYVPGSQETAIGFRVASESVDGAGCRAGWERAYVERGGGDFSRGCGGRFADCVSVAGVSTLSPVTQVDVADGDGAGAGWQRVHRGHEIPRTNFQPTGGRVS